MARKGVRRLSDEDRERVREDTEPDRGRRADQATEVWIDEGRVDGGNGAVPAGRSGRGDRSAGRARLPPDVIEELARGGTSRSERDVKRLGDATRAYRRESYAEARRLLEPLARNAPGVAAVRELHGLTLYRLGRWKAAIRELQAAERLAGSVEHHPVLADCHRALGHHREVQRLWHELREGDAPGPVVVEGRIVAASALADRGEVADAIHLLEQGPVEVRKPKEHHLRLWYVLAALYEQAGDVARSRQLLARLLDADPDFPGAFDRYRALG